MLAAHAVGDIGLTDLILIHAHKCARPNQTSSCLSPACWGRDLNHRHKWRWSRMFHSPQVGNASAPLTRVWFGSAQVPCPQVGTQGVSISVPPLSRCYPAKKLPPTCPKIAPTPGPSPYRNYSTPPRRTAGAVLPLKILYIFNYIRVLERPKTPTTSGFQKIFAVRYPPFCGALPPFLPLEDICGKFLPSLGNDMRVFNIPPRAAHNPARTNVCDICQGVKPLGNIVFG